MNRASISARSNVSRGHRPWTPPLVAELQTLLPSYQFLELIGRGEVSAVYYAIQREKNRDVAIKVLPSDVVSSAGTGVVERFHRDAKAILGLSHPGITAVYEQGEVGLLFFVVMELVEGNDLARHLRVRGKLSQSESVDIAVQLCAALELAHQRGVVHRDIRPANVLREGSGRVKIMDFGLARDPDSPSAAVGAGDFAAPEISDPGAAVDGRADLYSLGVTLYQLLTGDVPRESWTPPSQKAEVDPRLDAIIERAIRPNPEERYPSALEFRRDLKAIEDQSLGSLWRRGRWRIPAVVGGILLCVGIAVAFWRGRREGVLRETRSVPEMSATDVDGIEVPKGGDLVDPDETTVEFWALPDTTGWGSLFSLGGDGSARTLSALAGSLGHGGSETRWDFGAPSLAGRMTAPGLSQALGNWTHFGFVASRSKGEMRIYTNGALFASKPGAGRVIPSTNRSLWIGRSEQGAMRGSLTEFRVWNRARSEPEIRGDYRKELKGTEPGLVLYLPLKEGRGLVATNRAAATGPKYNGVLRGKPSWIARQDPVRTGGIPAKESAGSLGKKPETPDPLRDPDGSKGTKNGKPTDDIAAGVESRRQASGGRPGKDLDFGSVDPSGRKRVLDPGLARSGEASSNRVRGIPAKAQASLMRTNQKRGIDGSARGRLAGTNGPVGKGRAASDARLGEDVLQATVPGRTNSVVPPKPGTGEVAMGYGALESDVSGTNHVAIGASSLQKVRGGRGNVAVGSTALGIAEASDDNTAVGDGSLSGARGGSRNLGVGAHAGERLATGEDNLYLGSDARGSGILASEKHTLRIGESGGKHRALYLGGVAASDSREALPLGMNDDGQVLQFRSMAAIARGFPLLVDDSGHFGRASKQEVPSASPDGATYPPGSYLLLVEGSVAPDGFRKLGLLEPDRLGAFTPADPSRRRLRFDLYLRN